eukprot:PhM_4_TR17511/c0_g1_i3/m.51074
MRLMRPTPPPRMESQMSAVRDANDVIPHQQLNFTTLFYEPGDVAELTARRNREQQELIDLEYSASTQRNRSFTRTSSVRQAVTSCQKGKGSTNVILPALQRDAVYQKKRSFRKHPTPSTTPESNNNNNNNTNNNNDDDPSDDLQLIDLFNAFESTAAKINRTMMHVQLTQNCTRLPGDIPKAPQPSTHGSPTTHGGPHPPFSPVSKGQHNRSGFTQQSSHTIGVSDRFCAGKLGNAMHRHVQRQMMQFKHNLEVEGRERARVKSSVISSLSSVSGSTSRALATTVAASDDKT